MTTALFRCKIQVDSNVPEGSNRAVQSTSLKITLSIKRLLKVKGRGFMELITLIVVLLIITAIEKLIKNIKK